MTTPLDDPIEGTRDYLQSKADGGIRGRNGTVYEVRVIAFELIKLFQRVLAKKLAAQDVFATWQASGWYIDDALITILNEHHHYEMKTGGKEIWGKKEGSIRWCFCKQELFDQRSNRKAFYNLVLSHDNSFETLSSTGPTSVNVRYYPNSGKPTVINDRVENFISSIISLFPISKQKALFATYAGLGRVFLEFDFNDVNLVYQQFQNAFQLNCADVPQSLDVILFYVSRSIPGMIPHNRQGFQPRVAELLKLIPEIQFDVCDGLVFYRREEGVFGLAPIELGSPSGMVFERYVLDGYFTSAEMLSDYMEELLEGTDDD
ncbi:hypothetical protein [Pararhizobium gei]|uniref:hypothetical protein n=1 Tax=Pararhizobium gei TaxID=1395951 RepID=UPI0023D9F321|nr:hypothetical protein [Rhizobium gei]